MGNNFSDNNTGRASVTSRRRLYADLPLAFSVHPNTQDVPSLKDLDAVKQSVRNLVLTGFTERPFQPRIGTGITSLLFDPADPFTEMAIKDEIVRVLEEYEPRANNIYVEVIDSSDQNAYQINIQFDGMISNQREEINFYLERTR